MKSIYMSLRNQKTMKERFTTDRPMNLVCNMVHRALIEQVAKRSRKFMLTDDVRQQIIDVSTWLTDPKAKPWLFLCGQIGNGKSSMLRAMQRVLAELGLPLSDEFGYTYDGSLYDSCRPYLQIRRANEILMESANGYESFKKLMKMPMLAIDDLGVEPAEIKDYGSTRTPIIDLLGYRYEEQLFTMISTNVTPDYIKLNYGDRIADRFNEMAHRVIYKNDSFRKPQSPNPPIRADTKEPDSKTSNNPPNKTTSNK